MAIPETGFFNCTPASIKAIVPEQTVAIEDEPLDSNTSETTLTVYRDNLQESYLLRHVVPSYHDRLLFEMYLLLVLLLLLKTVESYSASRNVLHLREKACLFDWLL
jgi:hypothetical protein